MVEIKRADRKMFSNRTDLEKVPLSSILEVSLYVTIQTLLNLALRFRRTEDPTKVTTSMLYCLVLERQSPKSEWFSSTSMLTWVKCRARSAA